MHVWSCYCRKQLSTTNKSKYKTTKHITDRINKPINKKIVQQTPTSESVSMWSRNVAEYTQPAVEAATVHSHSSITAWRALQHVNM